jgi:hypothetical protein
VIEKSIQSLRKQEDANQMEKASDVLFDVYKTDKELTAFTVIDMVEIRNGLSKVLSIEDE